MGAEIYVHLYNCLSARFIVYIFNFNSFSSDTIYSFYFLYSRYVILYIFNGSA